MKTKSIMKSLALVAVAGSALVLTGCTTVYPGGPIPTGAIVTSVTAPAQALAVATDPNASSQKTGVSSDSSILGLFAYGDGGIDAAMQNGGITKVNHVDHHVTSFLGLWLQDKTIVHGE